MSEIHALLPGIRNPVSIPEEFQELAKTLDATGNQHDGRLSMADATGDPNYIAQLSQVLDGARHAAFERAATGPLLRDPERIAGMQAKTALRGRVQAAIGEVFPDANPPPRVINIGTTDSESQDLKGRDVTVVLPPATRRASRQEHSLFIADSDSQGTIALKLQIAFGKMPAPYEAWAETIDATNMERYDREKAKYIARAVFQNGPIGLPVTDWGRYHEKKEPADYPKTRFVDAVEFDEAAGTLTIRQPHGTGAGTTVMGVGEIHDRFTGEGTGKHAFMVRWTSADGSESKILEMQSDSSFPPKWEAF